jgi:DNA-binding response OmpR family regulator
MTTPRATTLPIPSPVRAPLRAVDALPASDFVSRAAEAGVEVTSPLTTGPLVVDLTGYTVAVDGTELDLSPRQVELLALFLSGPRKVWSREQLHWVCWGDTSPSRRVDVQLCRLRAKTGLDLFRNVRDRGWALRTDLGEHG